MTVTLSNHCLRFFTLARPLETAQAGGKGAGSWGGEGGGGGTLGNTCWGAAARARTRGVAGPGARGAAGARARKEEGARPPPRAARLLPAAPAEPASEPTNSAAERDPTLPARGLGRPRDGRAARGPARRPPPCPRLSPPFPRAPLSSFTGIGFK